MSVRTRALAAVDLLAVRVQNGRCPIPEEKVEQVNDVGDVDLTVPVRIEEPRIGLGRGARERGSPRNRQEESDGIRHTPPVSALARQLS